MKNKWALFGSFLPLVENKVVSNAGTLKLGIFKIIIKKKKTKLKEISSRLLSPEMSLFGKRWGRSRRL